MIERPILYSGPMVRAILADLKTQTRRVAKLNAAGRIDQRGRDWHPENPDAVLACPYGKVGDRLWVRETWRVTGGGAPLKIRDLNSAYRNDLQFRADRDESYIDKYHPSIFMPRWASRITLEIVKVRLERLQDISRGDCMAEGCPFPNMADGHPDPRQWYAELWDSINGKKYPWSSNPWVWVIEFKRV